MGRLHRHPDAPGLGSRRGTNFKNVDRYVFISTISVFQISQPGMDESGPLAKYAGADAMAETQQLCAQSQLRTAGQSENEAETLS